MLIIPAIDLKDNKCVRLWQGKRDKEIIYSDDPLAIAKLWEERGAPRLHIVDLDGAFSGKPKHLKLLGKIRKVVQIPLEFGGGIRDMVSLRKVLEARVDFAILGSKALSLDFVKRCVQEFGDKIIISLDCQEGRLAIKGWEEGTSIKAKDLVMNLKDVGITSVVFTDIKRDGTMKGINIKVIKDFLDFLKDINLNVIVSGGISSLEDIKKIINLRDKNVGGMIIGKALYTGGIDLEEALKLVRLK